MLMTVRIYGAVKVDIACMLYIVVYDNTIVDEKVALREYGKILRF